METNTLPATLDVAEIQTVIGQAPTVLETNKTSVAKALAAGNQLIVLVQTDGMSDLMDAQLFSYQSKVKVTVKTMNENRKGFTQLVDKLKKEFTSLESALDPIVDQIQTMRNAYATKKINEQKEIERKALAQKQKDMEAIELRRQAEVSLSGMFQQYLTRQLSGMVAMFEEYTLENIDSASVGINAIKEDFSHDVYDRFTVPFFASYMTNDEALAEIATVKTEDLFNSFSAQFKTAVSAEKRSMLDKLPSKKQELFEISKANAEQKLKLEEDAKKRKEEEAQRIKDNELKAQQEAAAKAAVTASGENANAMVSAQAVIGFAEAPKVKESYKIQVTNNAAYLMIAQFWFEKQGKNETQEKIERKTFAQMKAFCEDYALKHEEKITSPFIVYNEVIKAK